MTNFKSGDKVELNCSVPSFCESVGKGLEIYDNCFIDDVATIKKMQPDGVGFWLERLDVNNNGANGIRGNEVGLLRMAAQPKPKKTKVEWICCEFKSFIEAYEAMIKCGGDFYVENLCGDIYLASDNSFASDQCLRKLILEYPIVGRRVETEITWKDALCDYVDECKQIEIDTTLSLASCVNGAAWDNEFIEMCRVVIAAVDGK